MRTFVRGVDYVNMSPGDDYVLRLDKLHPQLAGEETHLAGLLVHIENSLTEGNVADEDVTQRQLANAFCSVQLDGGGLGLVPSDLRGDAVLIAQSGLRLGTAYGRGGRGIVDAETVPQNDSVKLTHRFLLPFAHRLFQPRSGRVGRASVWDGAIGTRMLADSQLRLSNLCTTLAAWSNLTWGDGVKIWVTAIYGVGPERIAPQRRQLELWGPVNQAQWLHSFGSRRGIPYLGLMSDDVPTPARPDTLALRASNNEVTLSLDGAEYSQVRAQEINGLAGALGDVGEEHGAADALTDQDSQLTLLGDADAPLGSQYPVGTELRLSGYNAAEINEDLLALAYTVRPPSGDLLERYRQIYQVDVQNPKIGNAPATGVISGEQATAVPVRLPRSR